MFFVFCRQFLSASLVNPLHLFLKGRSISTSMYFNALQSFWHLELLKLPFKGILENLADCGKNRSHPSSLESFPGHALGAFSPMLQAANGDSAKR